MGVTLLEQLGRGGMGVAWKALDESGRTVVMVALDPGAVPPYSPPPWPVVEMLGRIASAYVSGPVGSGVYDGVAGVLFELPDGPKYRDLLAKQGPLSWNEARAILKQIALGLVRIHAAGAVACGLESSTVFAGTDGLVKLAGFALAPAPEDDSQAGVRADLDGLGRFALELMIPRAKGKASELSKLPEEARPIAGWLLAADPSARPQSAQEFLAVLSGQKPIPDATAAKVGRKSPPEKAAAVAAPEPAVAAPAPAPVPAAVPDFVAPPRRRRSPLAVGLAVGAIVVVVAGLVALAAVFPRSQADPTPTLVIAHSSPTAAPTQASPTPSPTTARTPAPPLSKTWSVIGQVGYGVWGSGLAQLPDDGRVLVFDALKDVSTSSLVNPDTGKVTSVGEMKKYQSSASMAQLPDGSVLAIGGFDLNNYPLATVERFDPDSLQWEIVASMSTARAYATATLLEGGDVLVAGGWTEHPTTGWTASATAEIYDRDTNTWSSAGSMSVTRSLASAVRMQDGRVLVTGGASAWLGNGITSTSLPVQMRADVYDPDSRTWSSAGEMSQARATHTSVVLPNGLVMVMGGWGDEKQRGLASTEVFEPSTGKWHPAPEMLSPHAQGRLVQLQDGRPMVIAGVDDKAEVGAATEVFDPDRGVWEQSGSLSAGVYWPMATVLDDGRVMVVGGVGGTGKYGASIQVWVGPSGHGVS
jgi:hypothetical protein